MSMLTFTPNRLPQQTIIFPSLGTDDGTNSGLTSKRSSVVGPVAGGVIGGLAFICIVAAGIFFWRRRGRVKEDWEPPMFVPGLHENAQNINTSHLSDNPASFSNGNNVPQESTPMLSLDASSSSPHLNLHTATSLSPPSPPSTNQPRLRLVDGLRSELQNLRSVVHAMRADRVDPPPGYSER